MKITGELLKAERIKKNLTIVEVATTLKLSSKIISSIEAGDTSELPAKTFIRGFVKSYATLLKLDADVILRQFQEEMGSTQPVPKNPAPTQLTVEETTAPKAKPAFGQASATSLDLDKDQKKKTLIYVSIACGLLGVILIINNTIDKYQKEAVIDKNKIEQIQPIEQPATETAAVATTPTAETTVAPIDKPADSTTASAAALPIPTTATPTAAENSAAAMTSSPDDFEVSAGKPVELIVEAKKEVEIFYAKGNTKKFTRIKLAPKEIQVIRSPAGLHLKSEDGSLFNLILNGVEKGPASSSNKPVRLTF